MENRHEGPGTLPGPAPGPEHSSLAAEGGPSSPGTAKSTYHTGRSHCPREPVQVGAGLAWPQAAVEA